MKADLRSHFHVPCLLSGRGSHTCAGRVEFLPVKGLVGVGVGVEPAEHLTVPVCAVASQAIRIGPASFERKYGINLVQTAMSHAVSGLNPPHWKQYA